MFSLIRIRVEADTKLAQNWVQSFFQDRGTDARFEVVKYHQFHAVESLTNASQVTFICPRFLGPNCYLPSKILLKVEVKLTDVATGQVPAAGKRIAPVNNILHSLFSSCRVWLGETLITKNPENYAHRAYIIDLMSYDGFAKYTYLEGQGWYQDVFGTKLANQTAASNTGFGNRRRLFLVNPLVVGSTYANAGVTFMGRLHTDLNSAQPGLIPHLGLKIQLGFSSDSFLLQKPESDTANYKLTITNTTLFCPVGQMSPDAFRQLEQRLNKEEAKLFIERSEVTNKNISKGSTIFVDHLFPGSPLPSRIILGFVPTENYIGTQTTSPFFFHRRWKKGATGNGTGARMQQSNSASTSTSSSSTSSWNPLAQTQPPPQAPPPSYDDVEGVGDYVYIEKVSLTLNGEQVDGLEEGNATVISDTANYIRLNLFLGLLTSTTGNNLTLDEFLNGFFFVAFDLTTSSDATAEFVIPAVRQGNLNLQVTFSEATPIELTLLIYAEYPTLIKMDKNRQIRMSY